MQGTYSFDWMFRRRLLGLLPSWALAAEGKQHPAAVWSSFLDCSEYPILDGDRHKTGQSLSPDSRIKDHVFGVYTSVDTLPARFKVGRRDK